jgi:chorismate mutase
LERIQIASKIGEFKKEFDLPIIDLERKRIALAKRLEFAKKIGLPEAEAGELFEFLHTIAVKTQKKIKNL